jgi:hypothetical protein
MIPDGSYIYFVFDQKEKKISIFSVLIAQFEQILSIIFYVEHV